MQVRRLLKELLFGRMRRADKVRPPHVLFIANSTILPTLEICLIEPLSPFIERGEIVSARWGEKDLKRPTRIEQHLVGFNPDLIVFCRYSGANAPIVTAWAKKKNVPCVFHIDDDLLNIPIELGEKKFKVHNAPERLEAIRHLLSQSDLVYCSTRPLRESLAEYGFAAPLMNGEMNASAIPLSPARLRSVQKIGHMGFDHEADLRMVAPAIASYLQEFPEVAFEMLGSIPIPEELDQFADRITIMPPVRGYRDFLTAFDAREWDIGICPLLPTEFNSRKSNLKWLEYTSVGAAVIASGGTIYDDCCSEGCGILASSNEEWLSALRRLTSDPQARFEQVFRAQRRLVESYSPEDHAKQILSVFSSAFDLAGVSPPNWVKSDPRPTQPSTPEH